MCRNLLQVLVVILLLTMGVLAQNGTLRGRVTDRQTGEALIGANIVLEGTGLGAATDAEGAYEVTGIPAGTYTVIISYIGYGDVVLSGVAITSGQTTTTDASLEATGIGLNAVTISASRRPEKTLEAPASVSILDAAEVRADVAPSAISALRNTTGVDVANTGIDRQEVVLRGFNNAFSGATYILTDYRQAAVPSLAVNIHSIMPNIPFDIDKVEVVRGPGSALYGPGVDAGVIHYITRDPIAHPGTDVSIAGGERASWFGSMRHAGALSETFGYKITAQYAQANDWELDPNDPVDAIQLEDEVVARDYNYEKLNVNGSLMYKFTDRTFLTANGGYSALDGTVLTGVGTAQAKDFGYSYGQLRLQSGGFFAQAYLNVNSAGESFLYGRSTPEGDPEPVVDNSTQFNTQAQYDFSLAREKLQIIVGGDMDITNPKTEGTINGRNEDDDQVNEYGAYAQGLFKVTPKLDLTAALRADYNNIFEEVEWSPRLALVFKATPLHSLRATYNRAIALPGNNSLNLDIVGQRRPITDSFELVIRGRGARNGFSFSNARAGGGFTASGLFPATGLWGAPLQYSGSGVATPNIPLAAPYGLIYGGLRSTPVEELQALLASQGLNLTTDRINLFLRLLNPNMVDPVDSTFNNPFPIVVEGEGSSVLLAEPVDVPQLSNTITETIEVGYKGLINNKLLIAVDGYYTIKENFIGPLRLETPVALFANGTNNAQQADIVDELTPALAQAMNGSPLLVGALAAQGLTTQQAAALIVGFADEQLYQLPVGTVQPNENAVPGELMLTYRNFGKVDFTGLDVTLQYLASNELKLFGNFSTVSDDFFDFEDLGVNDPELSLALNAAKFKAKGGFSYDKLKGISFGASGRFIKGFPVESGPYVGGRPERGDIPADVYPLIGVEDYFLLDVNLGYDLYNVAPGLRFDIAGQNVLNEEHREFVGAPLLGRLVMGRLSFSF